MFNWGSRKLGHHRSMSGIREDVSSPLKPPSRADFKWKLINIGSPSDADSETTPPTIRRHSSPMGQGACSKDEDKSSGDSSPPKLSAGDVKKITGNADLLSLAHMYEELKKEELGGIKLGLGTRRFLDDTVIPSSSQNQQRHPFRLQPLPEVEMASRSGVSSADALHSRRAGGLRLSCNFSTTIGPPPISPREAQEPPRLSEDTLEGPPDSGFVDEASSVANTGSLRPSSLPPPSRVPGRPLPQLQDVPGRPLPQLQDVPGRPLPQLQDVPGQPLPQLQDPRRSSLFPISRPTHGISGPPMSSRYSVIGGAS